jgi:hypothetical protein
MKLLFKTVLASGGSRCARLQMFRVHCSSPSGEGSANHALELPVGSENVPLEVFDKSDIR